MALPDTGSISPGHSLRVSLSTEGELQVLLDGAAESAAPIVLARGKEGETLVRILEARLTAPYQLGEDGQPTEAQVRHWERHEVWPDGRCPFCVAEGRISGPAKSRATLLVISEAGGVTIRRLPEGARGAKPPTKPRVQEVAKRPATAMGL